MENLVWQLNQMIAAVKHGVLTFEAIESFVYGRMPQEPLADDHELDPDAEDAINRLDVALSKHQPCMKSVDGKMQPTGRTLAMRRDLRRKLMLLTSHGYVTADTVATFMGSFSNRTSNNRPPS